MGASKQDLVEKLQQVIVPGTSTSVIDARFVAGAAVADDGEISITLDAPSDFPHRSELQELVRTAITPLAQGRPVTVQFKPSVASRPIAEDDPVPGAKNIVLIMSGKGGVGKSTVASNVALALSRQGNRVGLLDADIYGPSVPTMFGVQSRPTSDGTRIQPISRFGIKLMSIGFLLDDPSSAVVWRGPMLHSALMQFLGDVAWGDLDFLLLDLPPGTGDVALTLSQRVRATGALIVTTPQEVALQDVYKSVSMAKKVGIKILGVVENESYFVCGRCETKHELFGSGGGQRVADMAQAKLLGQIPLDSTVRQWGDGGMPVVQAMPGSPVAREFERVAEQLTEIVNAEAPQGAQVRIDRSGGVNRHLPVRN